MKKYTILVSGASGIVGYGILKSLRRAACKSIGTTIYEESPANCFADIVETAPMTDENRYLPWLISVVEKYHVDMIIPGIEADVFSWAQNKKEIQKSGVKILLNNCDLIELCKDKWNFYKKLKSEGFDHCIPTSVTPNMDQFALPFILKPRCGYGSKGFIKIESKEKYELYKNRIGNELVMQEYIGSDDEEYTVSAFFDHNSALKSHIVMKRKLSREGFTEIAEVVFQNEILKIVNELAEIFKPVGVTNFQFRKDKDDWKLLEINPRFSSSTSIRSEFGYNEAKMCIDYFLEGKEIVQPKLKTGKAIRYVEDYIFYDSDNI